MPIAVPRAVIFDLDGTVVDNMPLHAEAFAVFADRRGLPAIEDGGLRFYGRRNSEIFPAIFGREMPREEWLGYEREKETLYRELSRGRLRLVAGFSALLEQLTARGIGVALATSAPAPNVTHTLAEVGLDGVFPVVVRGDQVANGKPAPDVFIEASRRLDVPAKGCLVFEDAPMGITAARAASMPVVAIATSFNEAQLQALADPPDLVCRDFEAFLALAPWR